MRPSNGDVSRAVAGEVLAEVFVVLGQMGVNLGTTGMKTLIDRVEARLQTLHDKKPRPGDERRVS